MQAKVDVEQELATPYNPSFDTVEIQLFAEIISEARLGVSPIDNKVSIEHIHDLIKEGNNRIQAETDKGILLLGNTGSGKTTFAHALCGISLQAMIDEDTADLFFAATKPLEGFIIGNRMASETKIPNKCKIADILDVL